MSKPYISLADFSKANPLVNHSSREIPLWQKGKPPYGLTIPKEQLFFGGLVLGMSKTNNLELINTGIKPLEISSITLNGAGYVLPEELPKIIYPGKSVILPVSFQPMSYGLLAAILKVDAGIGGTYQFRLLGQGVWDHVGAVTDMLNNLWGFLKRATQPALTTNGPLVDLSNTVVEFKGETLVGEESDDVVFVINNAGNQPLVIDNITVTGEFELVP